jgi:hypothetical protein
VSVNPLPRRSSLLLLFRSTLTLRSYIEKDTVVLELPTSPFSKRTTTISSTKKVLQCPVSVSQSSPVVVTPGAYKKRQHYNMDDWYNMEEEEQQQQHYANGFDTAHD